MKNVLLLGSNGMIGNLILKECLQSSDVCKIISIVRKKSGIEHLKLIEVIHDDFLNFSPIATYFQNIDICQYCIGVYTGAVSRDIFAKITIDFTKSVAELLRKNNEKTTFCFLSGQGADQSEKSRIMFAKDKGIAENILFKLKFNKTYTFRPGYIFPNFKRKEPNITYKLMRILYKPFLKVLYPNIGVTSQKLAQVMFQVGLNGFEKTILENNDIRLFEKK